MSFSGIRTKTLYVLVLSVSIFNSLTQTIQAGCLKGAVVSGGEHHTLVLMADKYNTVWACGPGGPRLGIGDDNSDQTNLTQVLGGEMDSDILKNIADIAAGWTHSLAADNDGFVWSWGADVAGQLGNGIDNEDKYTPVRVLSGEQSDAPCAYLQDVVDISAGRSGNHSLAVSSNGYCWAWGADSHGQVGDGSDDDPHNVPSQVHGVGDTGVLENIVAVSGGEVFSIALEDLNEGGQVFAFGEDDLGQLGNDRWFEMSMYAYAWLNQPKFLLI